jgi:hypothetical protein
LPGLLLTLASNRDPQVRDACRQATRQQSDHPHRISIRPAIQSGYIYGIYARQPHGLAALPTAQGPHEIIEQPPKPPYDPED